MKKFNKGDLVGIRYGVSGGFSGLEYDWRCAVYVGINGDRHVAVCFPMVEGRSGYGTEVHDGDIKPASELWDWMKGMRIVKDGK